MALTLPWGTAALPLVPPNRKARQTSGPGDGEFEYTPTSRYMQRCGIALHFVTGLDRSIK